MTPKLSFILKSKKRLYDVIGKRATSGSEWEPEVENLAPVERDEIYTPFKFHQNQITCLGGDRFAHIK